MIKKKLQQIIDEKGSSIVVLKGFETSELPRENKYFSFDMDCLDKLNLDLIREQVADDVIENRKFMYSYKWMTMEEYQLFRETSNFNKMPILILENNLYYNQYPYCHTLSNIDNIYHYLYNQEDNELGKEEEKLFQTVSLFYGKIDYSNQSGNYYVTYPELEDNVTIIPFYENIPLKVNYSDELPKENIQWLELSDDEIPFLDLELEMLNNTGKTNIAFVLSGSPDKLPNRYLERLNIISKIIDINFYFTTSSIKRQIIENEEAYREILKDVYGYDVFRDIEFYKSIESLSKETISISQAQIIDDIVIQAEKAMRDEAFRDVYITASTGAGKSLMFQIPALYLAQKYSNDKPLTLVISPLIGLMNDQVGNMRKKGVNSSATINGNTPLYEKEKILAQIQNQEVDVLYLSPETLQARSDIKMLIGDRKIGIVIIDEAHIVTTWGKSFRADYWYLGIYLAKLRKEYKFPIVTFTATAIYGGQEDMYLDTRNSLNMISPISYFGKVRRDNLCMCLRSSKKDLDDQGKDYRKTKNALALRHLKAATKKNQKSLLYFPTIKLLLEFYRFVEQNEPEIFKKVGKYYGTLQKEEKDTVLSEYKSGELQFVLATKAFGMGIDIPDITNVYHYAPTGNVVDYIQEIGRAARDKEKVEYGCGYGVIDFLPRDMNEVKQFHGMSSIRKTQILEVMKKILSIYKEKGYNRNLIISPEDFKYIFVQNQRDESSLDNKLKTVLLMIEKDFSLPNKLGYSPFVARPRSVFGNDLIFGTKELESQIVKMNLQKFFFKEFELNSKMYSTVYRVDLSGIWEKYYKRMSFPSFKFSLINATERETLQHKRLFETFIFTSGIVVSVNIPVKDLLSQYRIILNSFEDFINKQKITETYFTVNDLGEHFKRELKIADKFEAYAFAQTIINSAFEFSKIKSVKFISEKNNDNKQRYIIHNDGDIFTDFIMGSMNGVLYPDDNFIKEGETVTSFYFRSKGEDIDAKIAALGIAEARKLLSYQIIGGRDPQIYLRMNSIYPLEKAISQGNFYRNSILEDVQVKHYTSVEMLNYLFTKKQPESTPQERVKNYSKWFWDRIEDYFMGILPNEVNDALSKKIK